VLLDDIELGEVDGEIEVCAIPIPENPATRMAAVISPFVLIRIRFPSLLVVILI
jgi:hypothetical protein